MADQAITKPDPNSLEARFNMRRTALETEAAVVENQSLDNWIKGKLVGILEAPDFEAINALMTQTGLTAAKSLVGRTFEILDLGLRESADAYRENSVLQKFCLVKAVDVSTGEEFVIDGGGDQFVAGLIAMRDRYDFPFTGTLLAMQTASGYDLQYWRFHDPKRKPTG